jgi:hypothetical protein
VQCTGRHRRSLRGACRPLWPRRSHGGGRRGSWEARGGGESDKNDADDADDTAATEDSFADALAGSGAACADVALEAPRDGGALRASLLAPLRFRVRLMRGPAAGPGESSGGADEPASDMHGPVSDLYRPASDARAGAVVTVVLLVDGRAAGMAQLRAGAPNPLPLEPLRRYSSAWWCSRLQSSLPSPPRHDLLQPRRARGAGAATETAEIEASELRPGAHAAALAVRCAAGAPGRGAQRGRGWARAGAATRFELAPPDGPACEWDGAGAACEAGHPEAGLNSSDAAVAAFLDGCAAARAGGCLPYPPRPLATVLRTARPAAAAPREKSPRQRKEPPVKRAPMVVR